MSHAYLKAKAKALAYESRLLRIEEQRRRYPRLLSQIDVAALHQMGDVPQKWPHNIVPPPPGAPAAEWRLYRKRCRARAHTQEVRKVLHFQRTVVLRDHSRALHLARAFMRGRSYAQVEQRPRWERVGAGRQANIFATARDLLVQYATPSGTTSAMRAALYADLIHWSGVTTPAATSSTEVAAALPQ